MYKLCDNRDHYRHWETRFHDYCLLEGHRNSAKDRLTETVDHFIAAKRPFELAVPRSAIPATEWNTLDDVIASKIPTVDAGKPWIWLLKIKEHYVGASTLMQDCYHFWAKMSKAYQTSISALETAGRTTAGRCSVGVNTGEFMRDKFLFGLNESFSRFREDVFYRDGQRKPEDPPFTLAFVVSQAVSFEAAQDTNMLANSTVEEQVHYTTSTPLNKGSQNSAGRSTRPRYTPQQTLFFSAAANNNTPVTYAQLQDKLATTAAKLATLQTSINRLPKTTVSRNLPPKSLLHWNPSVKTLEWLSKRKVSTLPPRKVYNMRAASPSQINNPLMLTPLHWHHPFFSHHRRPKAISFY